MPAGNITQILPNLQVPDVPTGPRASGSQDIAAGLFDLARGVDHVMTAEKAYVEHLRQARDKVLAKPSTDYVATKREFQKQATQGREAVRPVATPQTPNAPKMFDDRANQLDQIYSSDVEHKAFNQSIGAQRDRLDGTVNDFADDAANAQTEKESNAIGNMVKDNVAAHIAAGILTPEAGVQMLEAYQSRVQQTYLSNVAKSSPARALKMLDDPLTAPNIKGAARDKLASQFETQQQTQNASNQAELSHMLTTVQSSLDAGTPPDPAIIENLAGLAKQSGNVEQQQVVDAIRAGTSFAAKLGKMSPAEGVKIYQQLQNDKVASPERDAALSYGRGMLKAMETKLKTDPLSFAQDQGLLDIKPLDFSTAQPADFIERGKQARMVAQNYGLDGANYFTAQERTGLANEFRIAEPDKKQQLMSSLAGAFGQQDAAKLFSELDGVAPAESHLAVLGVSGQGREVVAQRGFRGQKAIAEKSVTLPNETDFAATEGKVIGDMFDARLVKTRANIIAGARALYAERTISKGLTGFDSQTYQQSLNEAMGYTDHGGGIGDRNGRSFMLPLDMTREKFNQQLDGATNQTLQKLSIGGGAPVHVSLSGNVLPSSADEVKSGFLVQSSYGRFRVSMTDPKSAPAQYLLDSKTGGYFEIDMADQARRTNMAQVATRGAPITRVDPSQKPVVKDQSRIPSANEPFAVSEKDQSRIMPAMIVP